MAFYEVINDHCVNRCRPTLDERRTSRAVVTFDSKSDGIIIKTYTGYSSITSYLTADQTLATHEKLFPIWLMLVEDKGKWVDVYFPDEAASVFAMEDI